MTWLVPCVVFAPTWTCVVASPNFATPAPTKDFPRFMHSWTQNRKDSCIEQIVSLRFASNGEELLTSAISECTPKRRQSVGCNFEIAK